MRYKPRTDLERIYDTIAANYQYTETNKTLKLKPNNN